MIFKRKPSNPNFSSGPTRKPEGWDLNKLEKRYLGRYHRSEDVKKYIKKVLEKLKNYLGIPNKHKLFLIPGSCTGAMESVIWSICSEEREITSIVYDYWGEEWNKSLKKLNLKIDLRKKIDGNLPNFKNIPLNNDVIFVWTGTSIGIAVPNIDFIDIDQKGLVISDVTSSVFIYDLPWEKLDISVFSWQKALGSESQHGIAVLSPKAFGRIKRRNIPKILSLYDHDFVKNTPSLLSLADFDLCLDLFLKKGGISFNRKTCMQNKEIIDKWVEKSHYLEYFVKDPKFRALTPCYMTFKKKIKYDNLFRYLAENKIAFDIRNYRKANPGIRIWTGPTIKKNDLIALTNWLDWSFNKFIK